MPSEIELSMQRLITGATTEDLKKMVCDIIDNYYDIIKETKSTNDAMLFTIHACNDIIKQIKDEATSILTKKDDKIQKRLNSI